MMLVIGNLPPGTAAEHLGSLMGLRHTPLRVFRKTDRAGRSLRYAMVNVPSDGAGRSLLRRRYRLNAQPLSLHPYQPRNVANERRAQGGRGRAWCGIERRADERRSPEYGAAPVLHLSGEAALTG